MKVWTTDLPRTSGPTTLAELYATMPDPPAPRRQSGRLVARALLAALVFPLMFVALEPYPPALRAACAALALVLVVVALFLPEPVDQAEIDGYTPAPVDPAVLMHHADQLCPVPASARPPVDQLLARVPATPTTEVDHVGAVELGVFALADRLDAYADAQNATLNRFAELLADKVAGQDERIDRIDSRLDELEQKLRRS
jgi:hypothetical protein